MIDQEIETKKLAFRFSGSGGEYFSIWIVNVALTILTLGIYSAWAKVRAKRYFYGNTEYDGSGFEYHAQPLQILKGKLIAFSAFVVYLIVSNFYPEVGVVLALILGLLAPWAIWQSLKFNARVTSYRNVHFSFKGSLKDTYKFLILIPLVPIVIGGLVATAVYSIMGSESVIIIGVTVMFSFFVMYLLIPYMHKAFHSYFLNNLYYGQTQFKTKISTKLYYEIYIGVFIRAVLLILIWGLILMNLIGSLAGAEKMFENPKAGMGMSGIILSLLMVGSYAVMIIFQLWAVAYIKASLRNHVMGNTKLGEHLKMATSLKVTKLMSIYFISFLQVVFTLGLAYPWAKIRVTKYVTESTQAEALGDLHGFINQEQRSRSALGEEIGEIFDMDMDVGF